MNQFLAQRPFERAPWLAVGYGAGIAAWVLLPQPWQWAAFLALCAAVACFALMADADGELAYLRQAVLAMALMAGAGCGMVWVKSDLVGQPAIDRPQASAIIGSIEDRVDEGPGGRIRLVLAARLAAIDRPVRIRVNVPAERDQPGLAVGAVIGARARLSPPAVPMLPGSHDFALDAWFQGIVASGSIIGPVTVLQPAGPVPSLRQWRDALARHVLASLGGSAGGIAAALATGDRGAIARSDAEAMRDAGLAHLLSIGGLHVSAVIAAAYFLTIRLFGLVPWFVLRVRLPLLAATLGALAGVGYTLMTGAAVPTIRSEVAALLVLAALVLGRDPLSLRLLAVAASFVMVFWPESVMGPSFQMSFGAVTAIIAFHNAAPVKRMFARRDEGWVYNGLRRTAALLAGGIVIELALMPIGLFHFHRAGIYGALCNLVAIPLTTFLAMPLVAVSLALDLVGLGAPAWWAAGKSLDTLIWLAHRTTALPGAVTLMPTMPRWVYALYLAGLLWLGLWNGRVRLWGLVPIAIATIAFVGTPIPDILIAGDGRNVGITGVGPDLVVLRAGRGGYSRATLLEEAGMAGAVMPMEQWPGAHCNGDFCALALDRSGRRVWLLIERSAYHIDELELAAACEHADIVIAQRRLPRACEPRLLKADRAMLARTGGMTIDLATGRVHTVAETMGAHGWFRRAPLFQGPWPGPAAQPTP